MKLADCSDEELGAMVRDGFRRLHAKRARDAAANGNVGEAKEIEYTDHDAEDDPPPTPGTPRPPARNGASVTAQDAALEDSRIRQRGGANMDGELHLARVKREYDPAASAALEKIVPGYGRLK